MPPWVNLANLFTLLRLALTPVVIADIVAGRHVRALAVFFLAAVTDILDGAAARRSGNTTRMGAYFDPIADKCLLSGVFLALALARIVPWWLVAIIFGRDLVILAGVATVMMFTTVRGFPPTIWGKLSTFIQISTAVGFLARDAIGGGVLDTPARLMLWPCVGFTVWSGMDYVRRGIGIARTH